MAGNGKRLRAIDLYSGVGGWSLGLRLAGIEVVASYERWGPANETNFKNNSHQPQTVDIRRLSLTDLPTNIDVVVGSPPCTQFSFSNRGGSGDIADGLEDIRQFLTIVDHLRPSVWAMENVPRAAKIIDSEFKKGGLLSEFAHLDCKSHIVDMAEYGLPQRRRRCIAGNFPIELLKSYRRTLFSPTLGRVVAALAKDPIIDPLYGLTLARSEVTDHTLEDPLSAEEVRINCANKMRHIVYNAMPFPDVLDRPVRTITATCTRVSRESIVISDSRFPESFRRLSLRERASLQGFPLTFQFYGTNYSQKLRMIGNAVPPAFAYLIGHAFQNHPVDDVPRLREISIGSSRPMPEPVATPPERAGARYPDGRSFRFAIPSLQLKSGVRFELRNEHSGCSVGWRVGFYFGTSKAIQNMRLDADLRRHLSGEMSVGLAAVAEPLLTDLLSFVGKADIRNMQAVWTHRRPGGTHAFTLLDQLDDVGAALIKALSPHGQEARALVESALLHSYGVGVDAIPGIPKLLRNSPLILAGLLIGAATNSLISNRGQSNFADKSGHASTG
ncbi:MAG TPA: DNA cytosine methyltransferase [Allosphingosinicella sp.]|nr:DNA cytosine methyltransferase [Allosphingosinicella sp.]